MATKKRSVRMPEDLMPSIKWCDRWYTFAGFREPFHRFAVRNGGPVGEARKAWTFLSRVWWETVRGPSLSASDPSD